MNTHTHAQKQCESEGEKRQTVTVDGQQLNSRVTHQ